jgi:prepilin-type N-terminal cleavage/methylation domain-containing protein
VTWRQERGLTLIEMIVSMVVLGILFAAAFPLFGSTIRHSGEVEKRTVLQSELRGGVDRLTSDLRQAYTGDSTSVIESLGSTQVTFFSPDRLQPFHLRRIAYRVSGGWLERAVAISTDTDGPPWVLPSLGPWTRVVGSITDPAVFTFQDDSGNTTTNPASVRNVGIRLVVATPTAPTRTLTYQTNVNLRVTG